MNCFFSFTNINCDISICERLRNNMAMHRKMIPKIARNQKDGSISLGFYPPQRTLIWLHGRGDSSEGFLSFFTHSRSPLYLPKLNLKIKLIQAPKRQITVDNNEVCHAWYDLLSLNRFTGQEHQAFNFDHINESLNVIDEHVKQEVHEYDNSQSNSKINPFHRIYIGGFSQGAVMSLHYALQTENVIAGALSFSGYLLKSTELKNLKKFPILLSHGTKDQIINEIQAGKSYSTLLSDRSLVYYRQFQNLEHSVCLEQLDMMNSWLQQVHQIQSKLYSRVEESIINQTSKEK